jgi:hypothetical protein
MNRTSIQHLSLLVLLAIFISLAYGIGLSGCSEKRIDLQPQSGVCDTANITFSGTIQPIIQRNCLDRSCHCTGCPNAAGYPSSALWDRFDRLKLYALDGRLVGKLNGTSQPQMPFQLPPLSSCDIQKVQKWVEQGAPQN